MIRKPFEQWLFEDVELTFGIDRVQDFPPLLAWLDDTGADTTLPEPIEKLRLSLLQNVETWNEDELKMLFIAPFLLHFGLNDPPNYRIFTQRSFSIQTEEVESSGRVEWFVATGKQTPRKPFFFLQEYKPEKNSGNDPLGQLLIAMVKAQSLNESKEAPLYGCYIIGRLWFFVIVVENTYGVSRAYDATQEDDLLVISSTLSKMRRIIREQLGLAV